MSRNQKKRETPCLKELDRLWNELINGRMTPASLNEAFDYTLEHQTAIRTEYMGFTIPQLKRKLPYATGRKAEIVGQLFNNELLGWCLGSCTFDVFDDQAMIKTMASKVAATTQEEIDAYALQLQKSRQKMLARKQQIRDAVENPKTLEDFHIFFRCHKRGIKGMNAAQCALYDQLIWERDRKTEVTQEIKSLERLDLGDVDMYLHHTVHTQKGYDLWVVTFSDWLDHFDWDDAYEKARALGGWYSAYDKDGAIPGIQFKNEAGARTFMKLALGSENTEAVLAERRKLRQMNISDRLHALADRQIAQSEIILNADRKTNTPRRVRIASYMEARARRQIAWAKTLHRIADLLQGKVSHPLDRIAHGTHLDLLASFSLNEEENPLATTLPRIILYQQNVAMVLRLLKDRKHCVRLREYLSKRGIQKWIDFEADGHLDHAVKILQKLGKQTPWYLVHALRARKQLRRMGMTKNAHLRHALRLYQDLQVKVVQEDPVVAAERSLVGTRIPGFFPTPQSLVDHMIELADLKPTDLVLEPSAGIGSIAESVLEAGATVHCIEIQPSLVDILEMKQLPTIHGDFMDETLALPEGISRILMNPPFENKQDLAHIQRAYNLLPPGGRLVAIASNSINTYGAEWLATVGARVDKNPEGAFKTAFRPTSVETVTIMIKAPVRQVTNRLKAVAVVN